MRAVAALAAGAPIVLGALLICVGAFMSFPLVFTVMFWVIGTQVTSFAVLTFAAGLVLAVIGFGLIVIGPRIWTRVAGQADD